MRLVVYPISQVVIGFLKNHQLSSCKIKIPILGGCCHICTWGCKALGILSCVRKSPSSTSVGVFLSHGFETSGLKPRTACWLAVETWIGGTTTRGNKVQLEGQLDSCKYTCMYCTYNVSSFFSHITRTWFCNASYGHYKEVNQKNISANGACAKAAGPESGAFSVWKR